MPGPEQRAREAKARRQEDLAYVRGVYAKRAEEKEAKQSGSVSSNDNTTSPASKTPVAPLVRPPVKLMSGHTLESTGTTAMKIQMPNHNDPSSPNRRKRKAEINGDFPKSEQEEKPNIKKVKPTSGYDKDKPYRGTAKTIPNARLPASARALEVKSTNASLKTRGSLLKQDTKNLNRNASKSKLRCGNGTSQPSQGPPKVVELDDMDVVVTGPLQQTKRDAHKPADLDTMEDVKFGPPQGLKRESERDQENESRKKPNVGNKTVPPAQKSRSFMQSIQPPGKTAAPPTNIRVSQEIVKVPVPQNTRLSSNVGAGRQCETRNRKTNAISSRPSKAIGKNGELPVVKKAETGVLGKRRREDDAQPGQSKRTAHA